MNKLFTLLIACALCAGITLAGDYFPARITVPAAGTTTVADIDLKQVFGEKALFVERVSATCVSGNGTGVVTFASIDHGVATTIATSTSLTAGLLYTGYPARTVTTSNTVLTPLAGTNGALVAISTNVNTVATSMPYLLKTVRASVAQSSAVSGSTVYNVVIFTK
jgi:hypothetical protein